MKAGKELDALIAEKVMGLPKCKNCEVLKCDPYCYFNPPYSTDIAAAWEVIVKLNNIWDCELEIYEGMKARVIFRRIGKQEICHLAFGKSAAEAICLAALKVSGAGGEQ